MSETKEPVGIMFCLDCMYKHSRDLEHHLEDAVRVTKGKERNDFEDMIDTVRGIRGNILKKIKAEPEETCSTCAVSNPGSNPGPDDDELLEIRIPMAVGLSPEETEKYIEDMAKLYERVKKIREKQKKGNPGACPAGMEKTDHYCAETIAPMKEFDPKSIRTVVQDEHRVVIGCPKGKYDRAAQRCTVGTRAHKILHPTGE